MNTVPVATFNELGPAQKLEHRLQECGIPATIHDESSVERFWFMSRSLAAIHLVVPQPNYLQARKLIEAWHMAEGAMSEAVRCPDCQSSRVEFPQVTRKFATPLLLRLFMSLRVINPEFYCLDCHFTWPAEKPVRRKFDVLGFPMDSQFWHPRKS